MIQERKHAELAGADIVNLHLRKKEETPESEVEHFSKLHRNKLSFWSKERPDELEDRIALMKDALNNLKKLRKPETKYEKQKLQQMIMRQVKQLLEINRVKRRQITNQGPHQRIDSEVEEFVAKNIEDKATYHGRRHDIVMYVNQRVEKRDLLNIANDKLPQLGRRLVKSTATTTVQDQGTYDPCKQNVTWEAGYSVLRSLQRQKMLPMKIHITKSSHTHHQRAHVKNIKMSVFSSHAQNTRHLCLIESMHDKAFIRPGTSEGLEKTRNTRILTLTDVEKAGKLPKYDWPVKEVYQTPASHRISTKKP